MKAVVTGGAGYIGSCLVEELLQQGHQVLVIDDLSTGFVEAIPQSALFEEVNILNFDQLRLAFERFQPEAIFHLAAKTKVEESCVFPHAYYETNVVGSLNIAKVALELKIKFIIFSSTAAVYGDVKTEFVDENAPLSPINPYGRTKLMAENIFHDLAKAGGFSLSVLRYFNVAGAKLDLTQGNRNLNPTQVIEVAALSALAKKPFVVFGTDFPTPDGSAIRDFIHIEDLVSAHILALEDLTRKPGQRRTFNCGYGKGFSVLEVVKTMNDLSSGSLAIQYGQKRAGDPSCVIADPKKIKTSLNWIPKFDQLDLICGSTLNFKKELSSLLKDNHR